MGKQLNDDEQKLVEDYEVAKKQVMKILYPSTPSRTPRYDEETVKAFEKRDIKKEYRESLEAKVNKGEGTLTINCDGWLGEELKDGESDHHVYREC